MKPIECRELSKTFGKVTALRGVNLEVEAGEVFGFLGPNGAGKSTTIRLLLGEIAPTGGSCRIFGTPGISERGLVGYLPSELALDPRMRGKEVLAYFASLVGGVEWSYVDRLVERFDADLSRRVGTLSTGNRQKIGVIAAFMHRPRLVILDEPDIGLDPLVQRELHELMRETAADGRTVFLSSHSLSEVERVADRVGIIRAGTMAGVSTVADLRAARRVRLWLDPMLSDADLLAIPGVSEVDSSPGDLTLTYTGKVGALLEALGERTQIVDMNIAEATLEDVFMTMYRG